MAGKAKEETETKNEKEQIQLAIQASYLNEHGSIDEQILKRELNNLGIHISEEYTFPLLIEYKNKKYAILSDGSLDDNPIIAILNGQEHLITSQNLGKYLGYTVSNDTYYAGNISWQLFWIDFSNEYGDGIGTIYLKGIDSVNKSLLLTDYDEEIIQKFNKNYTGEKLQNKNQAITYLLTPTNENNLETGYWKKYFGNGANSTYGAPSLSMYIQSYNTFLKYYSYINNGDGIYNSTPVAEHSTSASYLGYNMDKKNGYYIGLIEREKSNLIFNKFSNGYVDTVKSLSTNYYSLIFSRNNDEAVTGIKNKRISMYNAGNNWWLASPSAGGTDNVMAVKGGLCYMGEMSYNAEINLCPIVSLKNGIQLYLIND